MTIARTARPEVECRLTGRACFFAQTESDSWRRHVICSERDECRDPKGVGAKKAPGKELSQGGKG